MAISVATLAFFSIFRKGALNNTMHILDAIQPVLLPLLQQEYDMIYQQDNARLYVAYSTRNALQDFREPP